MLLFAAIIVLLIVFVCLILVSDCDITTRVYEKIGVNLDQYYKNKVQ